MMLTVLTAVGQASTCCSAAFAQRKATGEMGLRPKDGPFSFVAKLESQIWVQQHVG